MSKKLNAFLKLSLYSVLAFPLTIFGDDDQNCQIEETPAVEIKEPPAQTFCAEEFNSRLQVGVNYTYVTFKPHGHTSFHGSLGGMQALYEFRPMNRFYGGAKFTWREGKPKGSAGSRSFLFFDVHERLGYTFAPEEHDWSLTLFSGFGYRHVGQKLKPKSGHSIRFNYNEFYIPVGMLTNYEAASYLTIGLDFIWMPQVFSSVTIVPLKGARWVTTNKLANFYVEMPFVFAITEDKRFLITFNPFYEHWVDGRTTAKLSNGTRLGLPGNTYNYYGAELNFGYCF